MIMFKKKDSKYINSVPNLLYTYYNNQQIINFFIIITIDLLKIKTIDTTQQF